jgi:hypothetical protein
VILINRKNQIAYRLGSHVINGVHPKSISHECTGSVAPPYDDFFQSLNAGRTYIAAGRLIIFATQFCAVGVL